MTPIKTDKSKGVDHGRAKEGGGESVIVKARRTVRVYVFDEAGRVLLIRCAMVLKSGEDFAFWVTPGGEIEPGEEPRAAAVRELREELGLEMEVADQIAGPLYMEKNQFELAGEMRDNVDHWFRTRCKADAPKMKGVTAEELKMMQEMHWWTAEEVTAALKAGEKIFPVDLAARMREFG